MTQAQYNEAINLIGHVILTAADQLTALLYQYGMAFPSPPSRTQLIDAIIDVLSQDNPAFTQDLSALVEQHIDRHGGALLALRKAGFNSYMDEDDFFGGLIKGAIGALGGLFKKKKKGSSRGSGNSSNANDIRLQQALQAKRDLERQVQMMQDKQRRLEEQAAAKARRNQMLLIAGGVLISGLVVLVILKSTNRKPQNYHPQYQRQSPSQN